MNAGLIYLLRRGPIARFRYLRRRAKGIKGALLLIFGVLFLLYVVGIQIWAASQVGYQVPTPEMLDRIRTLGTAVLFALTLLNFTVGGGIYFRPQELDFLFPAPIARRDLLLYHHLRTLGILLISSTWMFLFLGLRHAAIGACGFLACFFAFLFLNLTTQGTGLLFGAVAGRVSQKIRRLTLLTVCAAAGLGLFLQREEIRQGFSFLDFLQTLTNSPPFLVVTAPCRPFMELFLANSYLAGLGWSALCLSILAVLFQANVWLDRNFEESAIRSSLRMQKRIEKVRVAGAYSQAPSKKGAIVLPPFPRLAGAGPILWRQAMEALRSWKGILIGVTLMGVWISIMLGNTDTLDQTPGAGAAEGVPIPAKVFMFALLATFLMVQSLIFDFRKDLDRMAYLKSLPISPRALAVGQIGVSAVIFTAMQAALLLVVGFVWFGGFPANFAWTLLVCAPFNWIVVGVQNLGFLLAPHRTAPKGGFDPAFMTRMIVQMLLRMCAVALFAGGAFGLGWIFYRLFNNSWSAALAGSGIAIAFFLWALVWLIGKAFSAFDVSRDIPG